MPKKTLALIAGLVLVTVILFIIALRTGKGELKTTDYQPTAAVSPTEGPKHTSIILAPNPTEVTSGGTGSVDVTIDPQGDKVTGFQLELLYDPTMLTNVKVAASDLFANTIVFSNKNNATSGTYSYWFALQPGQKPVTTAGTVATITFTARGVLGKQSQIFIQPSSLVTAEGIVNSVMKEATGVTVVIVSPVTPTTAVQGAKVKLTPTPTKALVTPTKPVLPKKTTTPAVPPPAT